MRGATAGMLALFASALAGCGSTAHFAGNARPPTPVDLTVYVNDARISVSPTSIGAGPVMIISTNQATHAVQLTVRPTTGGNTLASTAPINPQATSSFSVGFHLGDYTLSASPSGNSLGPVTISSASLHIKGSRARGKSALLEPWGRRERSGAPRAHFLVLRITAFVQYLRACKQ